MISFLETVGFSEAISEPPLASPCICSCVINTHSPSDDDHGKCSDTLPLTDHSIPITIFHLVKFETFKSLQMVLTSTHVPVSCKYEFLMKLMRKHLRVIKNSFKSNHQFL